MSGQGYMPQAQKTDWETPPDLFDALWKEFGPFDLDPACTPTQYTATRVLANGGTICIPPDTYSYSGSTQILADGLVQPWRGRVFLNPPYGREMPRWIERAVAQIEAANAELALALIPSRTDTRMWQKHILHQVGPMRGVNYCVDAHVLLDVVRFLPGRLKFGGQKGPAPFPSAIVVWRRLAL